MKLTKKQIAGASLIAIFVIGGVLLLRLLFSSPAQNSHQSVRFIQRSGEVNLSRFATQVEAGMEPAPARQTSWSSETIKEDFDAYISSPPIPKIPLLEEPAYEPAYKPAMAKTKSGQIVSAEEVFEVKRNKSAGRGFRHSFEEDIPATTVISTVKEQSPPFQAKLFADVNLSSEAPVTLQITQAFIVNNCEIKKNTLITAYARRQGQRVEFTLTGIPGCGGMVICSYCAYGVDGKKGLFMEAQAGNKGIQTATSSAKREATQAVNSVLSTYGGVAGRVLGSGISDVVSGTGRADNTILLVEGMKVIFREDK